MLPHSDQMGKAMPSPSTNPYRILRSSIYHIVEKRMDARERYVRMALDTLCGPLEVWKLAFTNDTSRLAFIGAYASKRQMLVSVSLIGGQIMWNFMQCDAKALNKHRHGELLFKRYTLYDGQEKGQLVTAALRSIA
ncbi:phage-Barnase-EndoU-ColicinE5/D-RelE like nuclease2 [compost metagenome]